MDLTAAGTSKRIALVAIVASVGLTGCGPGGTITTPPRPTRTISGVLDGALLHRAECAWITEVSGTVYDVSFPVGWTVRVEPFRVVEPGGGTVLKAGDHVKAVGTIGSGDSVCDVGQLFEIESVTVVESDR